MLTRHVESSVALREERGALVRSAHVTLADLEQLDQRLREHLHELHAAGTAGLRVASEALTKPGVGTGFTAAVLALRANDAQELEQIIKLARMLPDVRRGLVSA